MLLDRGLFQTCTVVYCWRPVLLNNELQSVGYGSVLLSDFPGCGIREGCPPLCGAWIRRSVSIKTLDALPFEPDCEYIPVFSVTTRSSIVWRIVLSIWK